MARTDFLGFQQTLNNQREFPRNNKISKTTTEIFRLLELPCSINSILYGLILKPIYENIENKLYENLTCFKYSEEFELSGEFQQKDLFPH